MEEVATLGHSATSPPANRVPKVPLVVGHLTRREPPFELEKCEMEARAYRVKLHFSLHCHLLPYHHLFLHCHFLLYHGLAFFCENAGVVTLRRQRHDRLDRFGSPDISIGHSDVHPGVSRRGRQKYNGNQEKLAHRRLHLMMATASPFQA